MESWYAFGADESDGIARRSADEWLVARAAEALAGDPLIHGRHLEIMAQNGVLILRGELASAEARAAAAHRAWKVEGVTDVSNQLSVSGEPRTRPPADWNEC